MAKLPPKTAKPATSATKVIPLVTPKHGRGKLQTRGTPGNKGGPGRPPKVFKDWCKYMIDRSRESAENVLTNKDHPAFTALWKEVAAHAHGRPRQNVEVEGTLTLHLDV